MLAGLVLTLATLLSLPSPAQAFWRFGDSRTEAAAGDVIALDRLPAEAVRTLEAIRQGGPFPYDRDGTVFGNRERLLPRQARGHYREYTVPTPGAGNRGARRIICGGKPVTAPSVCWYTADHYQSFLRIVP